jgi:hypothetical protein
VRFRHCVVVTSSLLVLVVSTATQNSGAKTQVASDAIPRMIKFSATASCQSRLTDEMDYLSQGRGWSFFQTCPVEYVRQAKTASAK